MLVLNNLPNVQILNGRSTKDDDDDEEEEENFEDDLGEINEMENNEEANMNSKFNKNISNRNDHLYSKMEEIEVKEDVETDLYESKYKEIIE